MKKKGKNTIVRSDDPDLNITDYIETDDISTTEE